MKTLQRFFLSLTVMSLALTSFTTAQAEPTKEEDEKTGLQLEGGLVAILQNVNDKGSEDGQSHTRFNSRADLLATLPLSTQGAAQHTLVGQLRLGQGTGVTTNPTYTGAVNSSAFTREPGDNNYYGILAQAYYQLELDLNASPTPSNAPSNTGSTGSTGSRLEFNVGKMDMFGFFDQNAVAGDETSAFLNNVFVHNPLLDSGGDIAADDYGFAPGLRLAYFKQEENSLWGASLGIFAAGEAAKFKSSPSQPLVIGQLEWSSTPNHEEARSHYRLYAWTNGQTLDANEAPQRHSGVGVSADQRLGRDWNVFARWGKRTVGEGAFENALTLGAELTGQSWARGDDALGLAWGRLKGSGAEHSAEYNAELYYRFKVNDYLALTPDFQWINQPAGDTNAATIRVISLRATLSF